MLTGLMLVVLAVAGNGVQAAPSVQTGTTVQMTGFKFAPKTLTIPVGTTVTWTNQDQAGHTATSDTGAFDTGNVAAGQSMSITFSKAGTFPYYCKYHGGPGGAGMSGTIIVTAAQAQSTAAPPQPTAAPPQSKPTTAAPAPVGPTPSLTVHDQPIVNGTITVAHVVAAQDGWIAVHMFGPDGKLLLTPLAGLAYVDAGTRNNVQVKLNKAFNAGEKLMPMLHIDAGKLGTYEFPNGPDVPVTVGGQVVMMPLTVQANANTPQQMPNTGSTGGTGPLFAAGAFLALVAGFGIRRRWRQHSNARSV